MTELSIETSQTTSWERLAERSLAGERLSQNDGLAILRRPTPNCPPCWRPRFAFGSRILAGKSTCTT